MRHRKKTKKLKRTNEERRKLFVDLSNALIERKQIVTFTTRGKWFRPKFERLITLCKRAGDNQVQMFRHVRPYLSEKNARMLIEDIVPLMKDRDGGYTRILGIYEDFNTHDKSVISIVE